MAQKLLKRKPHKVAPTDAGNRKRGMGNGRAGAHPALSPLRGSLRSEDMRTPSAVLVGTYKEKQLAWIKRHGIYNYPVREGDFSRVERVDCVDGVGGFRIGHERASNHFETAGNVFAIAS